VCRNVSEVGEKSVDASPAGLAVTVTHEDMELYKSTEIACARAISVLLSGIELIVDPEEESTTLSPSTGGSYKVSKAVTEIDKKSKIFYKYLHVLQSLLLSSFHRRESSVDNELTQVTISALCNLLHANTGIRFLQISVFTF
jgi:hypothetical protein